MSEQTAPLQQRRSSSRSRRSHPSFSDLRLAPLTVQPKQSARPSLDSPRTPGHSSYLAARSNPSSPGILSRSSSKRRHKSTLGDDGDLHDVENVEPAPYAYEGLRPGYIDASSGYLDERPKSLSESGLNAGDPAILKGKKYTRPLSMATAPHKQKANHKHRRSLHLGHGTPPNRSRAGTGDQDSWLTHATSFTTALLAEGKGQAWIATHSSMTNLHGYVGSSGGGPTAFNTYNASDADNSDDNAAMAESNATILPSRKQRFRRSVGPGGLHPSATAPSFTLGGDYDEPQRSPAFAVVHQGWGSRFGSRSNSVVNSRRASRSANDRSGLATPFAMTRPSTSHGDSNAGGSVIVDDYDDDVASRPAFVDPAAQAEIAASLAAIRAQQVAAEAGYFDQSAHQHHSGEDADSSDEDADAAEEELARLARTPGALAGGPFGFIDRLVGMSTFAFDGEDVGKRVADRTDDEDDDDDVARRSAAAEQAEEEQGNRKRRSVMTDLQALFSRQQVAAVAQDAAAGEQGSDEAHPRPAQQEGGGWTDAAWLLSVASKLLL